VPKVHGYESIRRDHLGKIDIEMVLAAKLNKDNTVSELVTCTPADTDVAAAAPMPEGTKYVSVYCASAYVVAMGEPTSTTIGIGLGAGQATTFPVDRTGVAAHDTPHVQSPTDGAVVRITYHKG